MNDKNLNSNKLYVLKPSIVISDYTKYTSNESIHTIEFETRSQDITIAIEKSGILKDVLTNEVFYTGIASIFIEEDKCINVCKNDKTLLAKYLWNKNINNSKYNEQIERYILSLKPFYTIEEIKSILEEIKNEIKTTKTPKKFTLKQEIKQKQFIRNVYTDIC